jgi:hypothetical protein
MIPAIRDPQTTQFGTKTSNAKSRRVNAIIPPPFARQKYRVHASLWILSITIFKGEKDARNYHAARRARSRA